MKNIIYAYKKINENKIVYVGQTVNLQTRHYRHTKIDPFDEGLKEYNYPLSKGIRKYGVAAYELIILEEVQNKEDLNEREKYWITYYDTYYNGYNQSLGGANPVMVQHNEEEIDVVIKLLKNSTKTLQEIADECDLSLTHVYNINIGARRKRNNESYPIRDNKAKGTRGLKFSQEECKVIHDFILNNPKITVKELCNKFKCSEWTMRELIYGRTKAYRLEGYNYPLR